MNKNEEKTKLHDPDMLSADADVQSDVGSAMRKYDRESNTRIWEGTPKIALQVLMSAFSIYCILMTLFSKALPERRLSRRGQTRTARLRRRAVPEPQSAPEILCACGVCP